MLSTDEISAVGLSKRQRLYRAQNGRLHELYPSVYAVGHTLLTPRGRWRAAVLACGSEAVLSHQSAAMFWGIHTTARRNIDVTTPKRSRVGHEGIDLHRVRSLNPTDVTVHDHIRVTTVARTLVDLADVVNDDALRNAIRESEINELFDLHAIRDACERANGRRRATRLLDLLDDPAPPTRSVLEDRFLDLCKKAGIPMPLVNVHIGRYEVDFSWPDHNLVVETDGARVHRTRDAFERDPVKAADLAVQGITVVRFTWRRITREPDEVVKILRALLA